MKKGMDNEPPRTMSPVIFCRSCASPLVQALDWQQEEDALYSVCLWCPDCGFEQAAILDRSQLVYLTLAMEEGFGSVIDALTELELLGRVTVQPDLVLRATTDRISRAGY